MNHSDRCLAHIRAEAFALFATATGRLPVFARNESVGEFIHAITRAPAAHAVVLFKEGSQLRNRITPLLEGTGYECAVNKYECNVYTPSMLGLITGDGYEQATTFIASNNLRTQFLERLNCLPRPWVGVSYSASRPGREAPPPTFYAQVFTGFAGTVFDIQHITNAHHERMMRKFRTLVKSESALNNSPDINDLAAFISCMDGVLSADNTNAFLTGALSVQGLVLSDFDNGMLPEGRTGVWPSLQIVPYYRLGSDALPIVREWLRNIEAGMFQVPDEPVYEIATPMEA